MTEVHTYLDVVVGQRLVEDGHLVALDGALLEVVVVLHQEMLLGLEELIDVPLRRVQHQLVARLRDRGEHSCWDLEDPDVGFNLNINFNPFHFIILTDELLLLVLAPHVEVLLVLQEDHEVAVVPEDGVRHEAADELLVHRDRLLERRKVLGLQFLRETNNINLHGSVGRFIDKLQCSQVSERISSG